MSQHNPYCPRYEQDDESAYRAAKRPPELYGRYDDPHRYLRAAAKESSRALEIMWRRPSPTQNIEDVFDALARQWSDDTAHLSSVFKIMMHPAYRQIIGMGPKALPLIFKAMQKGPGHWIWALESITRHNPVDERPEIGRDMRAIKAAWIEWGTRHGHI